MSDEKPIEHVRIFMTDQTAYDCVLTVSWEVFTNILLTHGCIITTDAFINRAAIVRMIRFRPGVVEIGAPAQVIDFPTPKGSA